MTDNSQLSEETKLPLKWAVVLIATAISVSVAGAFAVSAIRNDISNLRNDVTNLKRDLVSRSELVDWRNDLADFNPNMKVPRIYNSKTPKDQQ